MHIGSCVTAVMLYLQKVAGSVSLISLLNHHAVANSFHRCTRGGRIIHAVMRAITFQHRMETGVGESGADTEKVERCFQECFSQAVALLIKIFLYCILL